MRTRSISSRTFLVLILTLSTLPGGHAQNSAFSYQGMLQGANLPANGTFDFQFRIFDAATQGNQIGQTLTRPNVVVRNGLFRVQLDFGFQAFDGGNRFLEIAVRPSGDPGGYVAAPTRDPVSAVPYAITARNFSGTLDGDVVGGQQSTRIRSIQGRVVSGRTPVEGQVLRYSTLTGQYEPADVTSSTGGGVRWEVVNSGRIQAAANSGYVIDHPERVDVLLPAALQVGDIVRVTGASTGGWRIVRSNRSQYVTGYQEGPLDWPLWESMKLPDSLSGNTLITIFIDNLGDIYLCPQLYYYQIFGTQLVLLKSSNNGSTWIKGHLPLYGYIGYYNIRRDYFLFSKNYVFKLYNLDYFGVETSLYISGYLFSRLVFQDFQRVIEIYASSALNELISAEFISDNGTKLLAVKDDKLYFSADYGKTWTQRSTLSGIIPQNTSADLSKLVGIRAGQVFISHNEGADWQLIESNPTWESVNISADGSRILAYAAGKVASSTNGGQNWQVSSAAPGPALNSRTVSADGLLIAGWGAQGFYTSADGGISWKIENVPGQFLAMHPDGSRIAMINGNRLYTSDFSGGDTGGLLYGSQYSSIELQYAGNGKFIPLTKTGEIYGH